MADFRKWLFALAGVALLAGLTVPASAQSTVVCTVQSATDNLLRSQGYTEQVGDVVLACTGGTPTATGVNVPAINITVFLTLNVTSQITAAVTNLGTTGGQFLDALLIVDEPNSATNPATQIRNCGAAGTNELSAPGQSGYGICAITSDGFAGDTYNGTVGHPNVFQGRQALGSLSNTAIVFQGVPFDPPGSATRLLRFTNIRVNANQLGIVSPTAQVSVTMGITSSGNASLPLSILSLAVGTVENGLTVSGLGTVAFAQCVPTNPNVSGPFGGSPTSPFAATSSFIRFAEGFSNSWKPRNISETIANGTPSASNGDGFIYSPNPVTNPPTTNKNTILNPADANQNVPGFNYYTEAGFEFISVAANPAQNPPTGGLTTGGLTSGVQVTGDTIPFADAVTGISSAGVATQGTRLAVQLANLPLGISIYVPPVIFLYPQGHVYAAASPDLNDGSATGVMVLTNTDSFGSTGYNPPSGLTAGGGQNLVTVSQSNGGALLVYEVLFADPFSNEYADVPLVVSYSPNLTANPPLGLPQPGVQATFTAGFAPFDTVLTAAMEGTAAPIPRFFFQNTGTNLFLISRCNCNLLFPFVTQQFGYDTGIAIANTSTDPFGAAQPQAGSVTFNYYGVVGTNSLPPAAQTTTASTPVATGTVLLYTLSSGNAAFGLDNRGANFTGYLITQAQFQYCHGFAFISALGAGPTSNGISEGYLALVLDAWGLPVRGTLLGESLGQ